MAGTRAVACTTWSTEATTSRPSPEDPKNSMTLGCVFSWWGRSRDFAWKDRIEIWYDLQPDVRSRSKPAYPDAGFKGMVVLRRRGSETSVPDGRRSSWTHLLAGPFHCRGRSRRVPVRDSAGRDSFVSRNDRPGTNTSKGS